MISKELLSEVLGKEIRDLDLSSTNSNKLNYLNVGDDWWYDINIYELAHKCKEWAYKNRYRISNYRHNDVRCFARIFSIENSRELNFFVETSETEAILKACEWILEQGNKDAKL